MRERRGLANGVAWRAAHLSVRGAAFDVVVQREIVLSKVVAALEPTPDEVDEPAERSDRKRGAQLRPE